MQQLTIAGNVGKDAELRTTNSGEKVLGFPVAVNNGKDKAATWYDCSIWGKRAEALAGHIRKGTSLAMTGRPNARAHDGKAYLGMNVDQLTFMGGGQRSEPQSNSQQSSGYGQGGYGGGYDDEVPFAPIWQI